MDDWWAGPWDCEDCRYCAYGYTDAEYHRQLHGHALTNIRGGGD